MTQELTIAIPGHAKPAPLPVQEPASVSPVVTEVPGSKPLKSMGHEKFCQLVASGGKYWRRPMDAYRDAGYRPTTKASAHQCVQQVMARPEVRARLKFLQDEALKIADMHRVQAVRQLVEVANGRMSDFMDEDGNIIITKDRAESAALHKLKRTRRTITDRDGRTITETTDEIEMESRSEALRMLGHDERRKADEAKAGAGTDGRFTLILNLAGEPAAVQDPGPKRVN